MLRLSNKCVFILKSDSWWDIQKCFKLHVLISFKVKIGLTLHSSFRILMKTFDLHPSIKTSSLSFCIFSWGFYFFSWHLARSQKYLSTWYIFQKDFYVCLLRLSVVLNNFNQFMVWFYQYNTILVYILSYINIMCGSINESEYANTRKREHLIF